MFASEDSLPTWQVKWEDYGFTVEAIDSTGSSWNSGRKRWKVLKSFGKEEPSSSQLSREGGSSWILREKHGSLLKNGFLWVPRLGALGLYKRAFRDGRVVVIFLCKSI